MTGKQRWNQISTLCMLCMCLTFVAVLLTACGEKNPMDIDQSKSKYTDENTIDPQDTAKQSEISKEEKNQTAEPNGEEKTEDIQGTQGSDSMVPISLIQPDGMTVKERFLVPEGFIRETTEPKSYGAYLQELPLKEDGAKVHYYDGREKSRDVYLAVVDFDLGDQDLQQCADSIMRLRAQYLYAQERYDEIQFHFVNGFLASFSKWADGYGIVVHGNEVSWKQNSAQNQSAASLQDYLTVVYAYASTLSLEQELKQKSWEDVQIGDVLIHGGSPGHCVIVVDMARNPETNEKIVMLAQGYMPAQDIQILKGEVDDSPWYSTNQTDDLVTPEWIFSLSELRSWVE